MNKQPLNFTQIISVIIVMAGLYFISLQLMPRLDKYFKDQAYFQCAQITKVSYTTAEGSTISHPYKPEFDACIKAKGY